MGWYSDLTVAGARPGLPGQKACSASVCQLKEELLSREGLKPRRAEILFSEGSCTHRDEERKVLGMGRRAFAVPVPREV